MHNREETKFGKLKKLLSDLPPEKAPDNFEFLLMQRITNNQFNSEETGNKFYHFNRLIPALTAFAAVIILFLVIRKGGEVIRENPLMKDPPVRTEITASADDTDSAEEIYIKKETPVKENGDNATLGKKENTYRVIIKPNDAVTVEGLDYPFEEAKSLEIDRYISNELKPSQNSGQSRLTGSREAVDFDGFFVSPRNQIKDIDALRARMDSIKKVLRGKEDVQK